jgi:hypothetical protein
MMWDDVLHLSGTIDALLYNSKDDSYIIVDWKRVKKGLTCDPKKSRKPISEMAMSGRGRGLTSFTMLRNNSYNKYGCQLTLYKHLFEHMTGKRVSDMFIVAVDSLKIGKPDALKIHHVPVDKFDNHIKDALEERARHMLSECDSTLDDKHMDALIKICDDGDLRRANIVTEVTEVTKVPAPKRVKV